ncbi:formyltransferase family protein [Fluviispira multicolorata]|uniref:phosphoribosylglycinamide formyltransferase 1 n=1 Tax=Fluviispira multicolorata TaxID=2654512 RepID=A0A833N7F6_9BACT|nr:formyltransferase family protein [Fluviispira multicolorata]KAB8032125.1 hypothetical protein GCL57_05615 [Fluviispira multicolorata]
MIVVFASGSGTNFEAIATAFPEQIIALICNKETAPVINKAHAKNIPCFVISHNKFSSRADHEIEIINKLKTLKNIKVIALAGYMRVLSPTFFKELKKITPTPLLINLHPANLEKYKGAHAYEHAVENKYNKWELTVHEVIEELDSGRVLNSTEFEIYPNESSAQVQARVRPLEHKLLIDTLSKILFTESLSQ